MSNSCQDQQQLEEEGAMEVDLQPPDPVLIYDRNRENISSRFIHSLSRFTVLAWQSDLICDATKEYVNDKLKVFTKAERADELLKAVTVKMDKKMGDETQVMEKFMEIAQETLSDSVYSYLNEELKKTQKPKTVLKKNSASLIDALQNNLIPFAARLKAAFLLTDAEYSAICDPEAGDIAFKMHKVLSEIRQNIKDSPDKLKTLVKDVIEEFGSYADDIAEELRKGIPTDVN